MLWAGIGLSVIVPGLRQSLQPSVVNDKGAFSDGCVRSVASVSDFLN